MRTSTYQQSKHLETSEVYPATARCPVCLAEGPRKPVFLLQDSPAIHLLQCPKPTTRVTGRMRRISSPSEAAIISHRGFSSMFRSIEIATPSAFSISEG